MARLALLRVWPATAGRRESLKRDREQRCCGAVMKFTACGEMELTLPSLHKIRFR